MSSTFSAASEGMKLPVPFSRQSRVASKADPYRSGNTGILQRTTINLRANKMPVSITSEIHSSFLFPYFFSLPVSADIGAH